MPARLWVILQEDIHNISLCSRIPQTVEELKQILQESFAGEQEFNLQVQDQEFDRQFLTLVTAEIKAKIPSKWFLLNQLLHL